MSGIGWYMYSVMVCYDNWGIQKLHNTGMLLLKSSCTHTEHVVLLSTKVVSKTLLFLSLNAVNDYI